jgi:hypothetical protein
MTTTNMPTIKRSASASFKSACRLAGALLLSLATLPAVQAQETVCARVKIEIKQELTLERQAFDAEMRINNTTDTGLFVRKVGSTLRSVDRGADIISADRGNAGGLFEQPLPF